MELLSQQIDHVPVIDLVFVDVELLGVYVLEDALEDGRRDRWIVEMDGDRFLAVLLLLARAADRRADTVVAAEHDVRLGFPRIEALAEENRSGRQEGTVDFEYLSVVGDLSVGQQAVL